MFTIKRLGLGTVQFGCNYGISNSFGRPSEGEIAAILAHAASLGIVYLDTAVGYGDAESLIGRLAPKFSQFRIVTKLPSVAAERFEASHVVELVGAIEASCNRLRSDKLYGVLVHDVRDLAKPGAKYLIQALYEAQRQGLVQRVGASIYDAAGLALVTSKFTPQLVQLPFNLLDRRLADCGWLSRLRGMGTEIHARSVFLQGLLLMSPSDLPKYFDPVRILLTEMHARWARSNVGALVAALAFVLRHKEIDAIVVGVNRLSELIEIVAAIAAAERVAIDFGPSLSVDSRFLNPALWPTNF